MMVEYQILERLKKIEQCLENYKQQQWLDIAEAVKYSGISKSSISRAIGSGKLKTTKALGKRMFKSKWLDNFLEGK